MPPGGEGATTLLVQDVVKPVRSPGTLATTMDMQASHSVISRLARLLLSLLLLHVQARLHVQPAAATAAAAAALTLAQARCRCEQMMAMTGGKERTLPEWEALLHSSGWRLVAVHPLRTVSSLIEARPT